MDDATQHRIDALEQRISELSDELAATRRQLSDAQLDQWRGRIDDIEVQLGLAKLETQEQLTPVLEQLRNGWLDAQSQLNSAAGTAGDTFSSLRANVESAVSDLLDAVRDRGAADDA